jgi:ABC-2 type transport system permease protein
MTMLPALARIWAIAAVDLRRWRRMPLAVVGAVVPPISMALLLVVLSLTVTQEPVALVVQSHGPAAQKVQALIEADTDAYELTVTNAPQAARLLKGQQIAGVLTIPPNFDAQITRGSASLGLTLNNIDIDFSDDIRRSVDRTTETFNTEQATGSSPYHIAIDEHDLRQTNVDFLHYQTLPVLILLILNVGLMGTALLCAGDVEQGTARILLLSPAPGWQLTAGRLLGGVLASLTALIPAIVLCLATQTITPPPTHWPLLIALFLATALCASSLGVVLGTLLPGSRNVAMASSVLSTYLFFLGGGFTTIAFLPKWLRIVSDSDPIRAAIDGLRQALFYPSLAGLPRDLAVLLGTAAGVTIVASAMIRRRWKQ